MKVIITGGSGMVGRALTANLAADGHEVVVLSRTPGEVRGLPDNARAVAWDARSGDGWLEEAEGATAIVNLAGPNIAGNNFFPSRWTTKQRDYLRQSRLEVGAAVVDAVRRVQQRPEVVIQASAIGYYGPRGDEPVDESAAAGNDFLASVAISWEDSSKEVEELGVRRAVIRSGLILSTQEGSLPRVLLPYRLFVGGPFGNGKQWWSWIHLHDEANAIRFLIENKEARGPFNLTAPNPLSNDKFGRTLARVLNRPHLIPIPAFAMRAAFGEVAMVVLSGQRVMPGRLLELGFKFDFPELEPALRHLLAHKM